MRRILNGISLWTNGATTLAATNAMYCFHSWGFLSCVRDTSEVKGEYLGIFLQLDKGFFFLKRVETLWVNIIELGNQGVEDEKDSAMLSGIGID
jgi:hypothetical protein